MPRILGLIPAKGDSQRLRRKNILPLGGRPLIGWAIDAARECGLLDRLIVSTEDAGVAEIATSLGAEVPFTRPDHLARDPAGIVDVALHALAELEGAGDTYDVLIILPPTSPFRTADDIGKAYAIFRTTEARFLMSVAPFDHTPFAAMGIGPDGALSPYFPDYIGRKSQEMPAAYRPNGAIHILDVPAFQESRSYFTPPLIPYLMPRERSVDIDTEEDLRAAEIRLALIREMR